MAICGCRWRVVCRRRSRRWERRSHQSGRLRNAEAGAQDAAAARVALPARLYRREALGFWATHRRRALQRNRQTRARIHWERSGEFAQVFCTTRLALSLPGLKLGKERKPYAAVRHLMKRASRPRGRGPRVALTATGSWWPRLRRRTTRLALSPRFEAGKGEEALCGSATPDEAGESPTGARPEGCADDDGQLVAAPASEGGAHAS